MKIKFFLILVVIFASCNNKRDKYYSEDFSSADTKKFTVKEVVQAKSYTYFKVDENTNERWVAVSKTNAEVGDVFYYDKALLMKDFHSKDLDKTFKEVYFINQISATPLTHPNMGGMPAHSGKVETPQKTNLSVDKKEGELTVADIFANSSDYAKKEVEIKGKVVKVNEAVMGKNWIHIQDGTSNGKSYDLTITTQDLPAVNDEVVFKGTVSVNRDFGSGYYYDVIIEDAKLIGGQKAGTPL